MRGRRPRLTPSGLQTTTWRLGQYCSAILSAKLINAAQPHLDRAAALQEDRAPEEENQMSEEQDGHRHDHPEGSHVSELQLRVRALETVLTEKGYVDPAALDRIVEAYETKIGPHNGARAVAKAWVDPAFRRVLLADATAAVGSLGFASRVGDHLVAVENTDRRHNMIVCTLCSCYPWEVLGLPPTWYKSAPYRSRAVIDPRGVLAEFGVKLPAATEIRVWDSTAETRFMVVPMRPSGTEGWSEENLARLVTRDSMIGTGLARSPAEVMP
jgi:nitrile hydratase subunit alpha